MFCLKALQGFKNGCGMCPPPFLSVFFLVCVKYSHFKPCTNLYDVWKSDNINVYDVCFSLFDILHFDISYF